jgi:hypothetical protein
MPNHAAVRTLVRSCAMAVTASMPWPMTSPTDPSRRVQASDQSPPTAAWGVDGIETPTSSRPGSSGSLARRLAWTVREKAVT